MYKSLADRPPTRYISRCTHRPPRIVTSEELAVVTNPDLTPDAARLVLYLMSLGEGEHEIPANRLQLLLRCGGMKPVYAARACAAPYLEWRAGGNKHSTRYRLVASQGNQSADRSPPRATNPAVVVGEGGDTNPLNPPSLSLKALRAMDTAGEKLKGCRGALRDYLEARVPPERQYPYVQWVVTTLDNPLAYFRMPNGLPVPPDQRTAVLADALNQLAATDEAKSRKWDAGDPANLETKLRNVVRAWSPPEERKANGTDGGGKPWRGKAEKQPQDAGNYNPGPKPEWKS